MDNIIGPNIALTWQFLGHKGEVGLSGFDLLVNIELFGAYPVCIHQQDFQFHVGYIVGDELFIKSQACVYGKVIVLGPNFIGYGAEFT